ncbi:MAG TPA: hypothetical protein GX734_04180 [Clostridiaceae bacterium]|nr:hypothetical protein [Clostridiaceae bacterium]
MKKNNFSPLANYPTLDGIPVSIRNDYLFKKIFGSLVAVHQDEQPSSAQCTIGGR